MLSQGTGPVCAAIDLRRRPRHGTPNRKIVGGTHRTTAAEEGRDAICAPQTHSQARSAPTTRTEWCARRVPPRSNRPKPPKNGKADTGTEPQASIKANRSSDRPCPPHASSIYCELSPDFFNRIDPQRKSSDC